MECITTRTQVSNLCNRRQSVVPPAGSGIPRREALKAVAAAAASLPILDAAVLEAQQASPKTQSAVPPVRPRGDAWDPDLIHPRPGTWARKLSSGELITLSALCDTIIPADRKSPSASAVGVPAWINEYVSFESNGNALVRVRGGLVWLNLESNKRFGRPYVRLTQAEREQICNDICYTAEAKPEFHSAALFFDQVRDLTASGFYTTREGMQDLGYIGNVRAAEVPRSERRNPGQTGSGADYPTLSARTIGSISPRRVDFPHAGFLNDAEHVVAPDSSRRNDADSIPRRSHQSA